MGLALYWCAQEGGSVLGAPIESFEGRRQTFVGPIEAILSATESLPLGSSQREGGAPVLSSHGAPELSKLHPASGLAEALEGPLRPSPGRASSALFLSLLLCISLAAIFFLFLGFCCFLFLRRLGEPKETPVPQTDATCSSLLGRWKWAASSHRSSSSNSRGSFVAAGKRPRAPLRPASLGFPGALMGGPHDALGPPWAGQQEAKRLRGPQAEPKAAGEDHKETFGQRETLHTAATIASAFSQPSDYALPTGCEDFLAWQPTHLQQQALQEGPPSRSEMSLSLSTPAGTSRGPPSCRTSVSAAAAAAIDFPTTFAVATPCSGGLRELLHWGPPGDAGGPQEEADLSVFASLPEEVPNPPAY